MLKYSPPNAQYVKPQDLLVPTTYNPHSVPTFIEDALDFVEGCPVHPGGRPSDHFSPAASPPASRPLPTARPVVLQRSAEKKVSPSASSPKHLAVPGRVAPPAQGSAENFGPAGSSPSHPRVLAGYEPSFAREQAQASEFAAQNKSSSHRQFSYLPYTPTYPPAAEHLPFNRPTSPPPRSIAAGSRFGLSHNSGIVDVMNSSTSEGYTTVSAVRRMRPTKQCC